MRSSGWFGAVAMGMVACTGANLPGDPDDGGQFGEEVGAGCVVLTEVPLALDEVSPLGFAAQDLLTLAEGSSEHELSWEQLGQTTQVTVIVTSLGEAAYLEQGVERDEGYDGPEPWCPNLVSVDIRLEVSTADGALAESIETTLRSDNAESASLSRQLEELTGTFDAWAHVPADSDYDELRAWLDLTFSPEGLAGAIQGQGSGVMGDPNDPNSAAYAENFVIAEFGVQEE